MVAGIVKARVTAKSLESQLMPQVTTKCQSLKYADTRAIVGVEPSLLSVPLGEPQLPLLSDK